jgi:hypothetical protein
MRHSIVILFIFLSACGMKNKSQQERSPIDKLVGEWYKLPMDPNKNMIETWEKVNDNIYTGNAFLWNKIADEKFNKEQLWLNYKNDVWIYSADPANQTKIDFKATIINDTMLRFENTAHDFPQYIQYKWLEKNHMEVEIGNADKKMAWEMEKQ